MALSNRDRIGKMFDIMSPALDEFIQRVVSPGVDAEASWVDLVEAKDLRKGIVGKEYSRTDPYLQLRMLSENITGTVKPGWFPFRNILTRVHESYASELRDARHAWAHGGSFTDDDSYRALDTAERLLRAVGAPNAADGLGRLRRDVRRVASEKQDRKITRDVLVNAEVQGLLPWREVLEPHEDVASGNFRAAEFAADLYKVATGDPDQSPEYADPVQFFARTYLTDGLTDLITRAVTRLAGSNSASPVINLQTNFGGGKTHSMLALWHLASGTPAHAYPQDIQELLVAAGFERMAGGVADGAGDKLGYIRRVALVGNWLSPMGRDQSGVRIRTIWGELAWQLGGREAFELVAAADEHGINPGAALGELLRRYSPALILIDEWVAYARSLVSADNLPAGTFETQFTFAQTLTEAVKATPGVLLAVSIPASENVDGRMVAGVDEEVGGANGREALRRLQNVVGRVADHWQPATAAEAYHIVRRRLFVEPDGSVLAAISATAKQFCDFYRKHSGDFPREVRELDYENRIKQCYPIHPELFERLYGDWSTLERFQRTRGVLRLMNTVIHELWTANDMSALIMPGSIPFAVPSVNAELTQYLTDSWRTIVDTDVDGQDSVPAAVDKEKRYLGQRSLAKRVGRTVFFGSAPKVSSQHPGLELTRVMLGAAVPGDVPGNFRTALDSLADAATYLYTGGGRYWYDTHPNITRRAKDQAERLSEEDVWAAIIKRLREHQASPGGFARVIVAPDDSAEIPDLDEARLILIHPRYSFSRKRNGESSAAEFARAATERRGTANRTFRNTIVYLAADSDRLGELAASVREYLAWQDIADHAKELDLSYQQNQQANERRDRADATAGDRLVGTYHWLLIPEQAEPREPFTIAAVKAEGAAGPLGQRAARKLVSDSQLATEHPARLIRYDLDNRLASVWERGHVRVGDLWTYYATYPYMPRLRDRRVLDDGVRSMLDVLTWHADGFATAEGYDEATGAYRGLVLPDDPGSVTVHDGLLLVRPDLAVAQRERDLAAQGTAAGSSAGALPGSVGGVNAAARLGQSVLAGPGLTASSVGNTPSNMAASPRSTRFFGSRTLNPERYAGDFKRIADEVLQHLAAVPDVELTVRVEIEARAPEGFAEDKVRTVRENATTLKFDSSGFEDD